MEQPPERSRRLHNFNLPHLRWGQQRFLRCVNLSSNSNHRSPPSSSSPDNAPNRSVTISGVSKDKLGGGKNVEVVVAAARPWNLRTRRAACTEPGDESVEKIVGSEFGVKRSMDIDGGNKIENKKLSISLSKQEIEEDFSIIFGKRPSRRPKKRPRIVQKKLNSIFPGLWLTEEVTIDSYNVPKALES